MHTATNNPSNIRWLWTIAAPQTAQAVTCQAFPFKSKFSTYSNFVKSCLQEASRYYAHWLCGWAVTAAKHWKIQQMCSPHAKRSLSCNTCDKVECVRDRLVGNCFGIFLDKWKLFRDLFGQVFVISVLVLTVCLVFATFRNLNLSICIRFAKAWS